MLSIKYFPRIRTVVTLGCGLLFCTFLWDLVALNQFYHQKPHSQSHRKLKSSNFTYEWSWVCGKGEDHIDMCQRVLTKKNSRSGLSLETCMMTCAPGRYIWPFPTGDVKIKNTSASFHPRHLTINFKPVDGKELSNVLKRSTNLYEKKIAKLAKESYAQTTVSGFIVTVQIPKKEKSFRYKLNIDESYKLLISQKKSKVEATIKASTFLGAHHGLETLMQLIWWDENDLVLRVMNNVAVTDSPMFTYRGLLIDTARNFLPISSIERNIEAMSMNKMNVFHWHLTDSKSFPYSSAQYHKFSLYGSYSKKETYSKDQITQVVDYAAVRGITVLMEVDAPAHTSQGWNWKEENKTGNLSFCLDAQPFSEFCSEPPCGQLNPTNNNSYSILVDILKELNSITKSENLFHLGGSSVDYLCWESFEEITELDVYMTKGVIGVWELFYQRLFKYLKGNIPLSNYILWSNELMKDTGFWKNLKISSPIVQSKGPSSSGELGKLVRDKYKVIVSSSDLWQLSEPKSWKAVYSYRPWVDMKHQQKKLVLGGEVCAWTDHVDRHSLEIRLWPATSAVAERLWSDPPSGSAPTARLTRIRERMVEMGIPNAPVGPKWCTQNPYQCL